MQHLGLNNQSNSSQVNASGATKVGFWKRQFQVQKTSTQRVFDWIFGVFMPLICFLFDPIVFKSWLGGNAFFGNYRPFAYLLCGASVLSMSLWLIFGEKLRWLNGFIAGLFFLGGVIALGIGIVLFPFSFVGLIVLIGALGFTPLFTAVIYLRNSFRALHDSKMFLAREVRNYAFGFGIVFSACLAWTVNSEIRTSLQNIENGDAQAVYAEQTKLKYLTLLFNSDQIVLSYRNTPIEDKEKIAAIADVYRKITGRNINEVSIDFLD